MLINNCIYESEFSHFIKDVNVHKECMYVQHLSFSHIY